MCIRDRYRTGIKVRCGLIKADMRTFLAITALFLLMIDLRIGKQQLQALTQGMQTVQETVSQLNEGAKELTSNDEMCIRDSLYCIHNILTESGKSLCGVCEKQ